MHKFKFPIINVPRFESKMMMNLNIDTLNTPKKTLCKSLQAKVDKQIRKNTSDSTIQSNLKVFIHHKKHIITTFHTIKN